MRPLAGAIRSIRQRLDQSQEDFAKALSVTNSMISKYEKDLATPGFPTLFSILTLCGDGQNDDRQVILTAMADSIGTDLDGLLKILKNMYEQRQAVSVWRAAAKRSTGGDEALAEAISEPRVQAVIEYYLDFRDDPTMDTYLTDAVVSLGARRAVAAQSKFTDLSEKELKRMDNLLYFLRHADADEVDEVVRRAAVFRRFNEKERKTTSESKPARRGRR